MGYELHITRAESWLEAREHPISPDELYRVATTEPDLHVDRETWLDTTAADGTAMRIFGVRIGPERPDAAWLWAEDGDITAKDADEATIVRMVRLARTLDATVQGDDHEVYTLTADGRLLVDGEPIRTEVASESPLTSRSIDARLPVAALVVLVVLGVVWRWVWR